MFFILFRLFLNPSKNSSAEIFNVSDYASVDACLLAVKARFHNVVAADLLNESIIYQMTFVTDNTGNIIEEPEVFDRRLPSEE